MIELTAEQRQMLAKSTERPPTILDPDTKTAYALVPLAAYQKFVALIDDDANPQDTYPALDRTFRDGWSDPKMDDYDRYEELKS